MLQEKVKEREVGKNHGNVGSFVLREDGTGINVNVDSFTKKGKSWTVTLWLSEHNGFKPGMVSCNCPAWIYGKGPKGCKHVKSIEYKAIGTLLKGLALPFATEAQQTLDQVAEAK